MKHFSNMVPIFLVIVLLLAFVGCSSNRPPVSNFSDSSAGSAIAKAEARNAVAQSTTLYGLVLVTIIVLIGVGLWLWEVRGETGPASSSPAMAHHRR